MRRSLLAALMLRIAAGTLLVVLSSFTGLIWLTIVVAIVSVLVLSVVCRQLVERSLREITPGRPRVLYGDSTPEPMSSAEIAARLAPYESFEPLVMAIESLRAGQERLLGETAEERRKLELVLDSMQDIVIAIDGAGRISWTNDGMRRLMASDSASVRRGHALVQTVREPEVLECARLALEERVVAERPAVPLVGGRLFAVSAAPMGERGAVLVLRDVTRIEKMERTQKEFVANVSHELRTPLTSVMGYVELLLDEERWESEAEEKYGGDVTETSGPPSSTRLEFLEAILKSARRMERLTEDLLVMAKVDSGEQKLNPMRTWASTLIEEAVMATSGLFMERGELEVGEVVEAEVMADMDAMLQVVGNLIENAINYGTRRGEEPRVRLAAQRSAGLSGFVEFSVQDFGMGIAMEHRERIFERFFRADKARSRATGGTGLGLSIARHLVEEQGGAIWVESDLGHGSRFCFTLPEVMVGTAAVSVSDAFMDESDEDVEGA
ncbi:two-component system, OmpR family, phosphate regulon sensor histidine kinase PhoR [Bryocella elongata]|uniref:histidine kinase n=1 Tax=Bryocella elongata TaxID=863522 RepID=A0A1H5YHU4_9BACT|nr:ATP-binding protein [Bryocella elongata]SEG23272.1 two-component system, OmpR family, phosphate regulon sensor histidine kinase PhoR [Bryocella elongata]